MPSVAVTAKKKSQAPDRHDLSDNTELTTPASNT
jgi:hypothetical protein